MIKNYLFLLLFVISCNLFAQSEVDFNEPIDLFKSHERLRTGNNEFDYVKLDLDESIFAAIRNGDQESMTIHIPDVDGSLIAVYLQRNYILKNNFKVQSGPERETFDYKPGLYYGGKTEKGGIAAFSFFENNIIGMISLKKGGNLNIGKLEDASKSSTQYVVYNDKDVANPPKMECHTDKLPNGGLIGSEDVFTGSSHNMMDCVDMYLEGDYALFLNKGGVTEATDYLTGAWNAVYEIYDEDDMTINIESVFIWSTPDPYSTTSSGAALDQFGDENPTFDGDLAHLCALGGNGTGGLAWLDVLCVSGFNYAYSNISSNYSNFPSYSWTVNVLAHEAGHNIGSQHTHACAWNGDNTAIDGCGPTAGYDEGCTAPNPSSGTVMSYCHLVGGVGVNFNNGFGPQPAARLQSRIASAGCIGGCNFGSVPTAQFNYNVYDPCVDGPAIVEFFDNSPGGPTNWYWEFEGGTPSSSTDQNPIVNYDEAGVFSVELSVSNATGSDDVTESDIIEIFDSPDADFDHDVIGSTFYAINESEYAEEYEWDFGDGEDSDNTDITYTYEEDGAYTVTLYAINDCGIDDKSVEVIIATAPTASFEIGASEGCAPFPVQFTSTSSSNSYNFMWVIPGASPDTSYVANPLVVFDSSGVFGASLTVWNDAGMDIASYTDTITISDLPQLSVMDSTVIDTVFFENMSTNVDSLHWDFGDGDTSDVFNPYHVYQAGGMYEVVLTAENECGLSYDTTLINLILGPAASFTSSSSTGCAPLTVSFTSTSVNSDAHTWNFPGGNPASSTEENPVVVYETEGSYDVFLEVSNDQGVDQTSSVALVEINDVPAATFNSNQLSTTDFEFINTTTNADSYLWDFGDGNTSIDENPSHSYENAGMYLVTLEATNICGVESDELTVDIQLTPSVSFSSSAESGCLPLEVTFTNNTIDGESYMWSFPGGEPSTSMDANPTVTYNTVGTFDVTLVSTNEYGSAEANLASQITISDVPNVDFTFSNTGAMANFMAIGDASEWSWDFGDGNTGSMMNMNHVYESEGTYTVILQGTNQCGDVSETYVVEAYSVPTAGFDLNAEQYCKGEMITLNNTSSDNVTSYNWTFEGANMPTSTMENPTISYDAPGLYTISLLVSNPAGEDTYSITEVIEILDTPTSAFTQVANQLTITFTNMSENASNCIWNFGDGITSTEMNPTHEYATEGDYTVSLVCENICGESIVSEDLEVSLAPTANFGFSYTNQCAPAIVAFQNLSSGNATSWNWSFPGGTPSTSTEENPTITYDTPGLFSVTLVASNDDVDDTYIQTDIIEVLTVPSSSLSSSLSGANLTANGDGDYTFTWFIDGEEVGEGADLSYFFSSNGDYELTMIATNDCGDTEYIETITVNTFPTADFDASYTPACAPMEVTLVGAEYDDASYFWMISGSAVLADNTLSTTTAVINESGDYDITYIVTTTSGTDTNTETVTYNIIPLPEAILNFQFVDGVFIGNSGDENATEHKWDFGNGDSANGRDVEYTFPDPGVYFVELTVSNDCGSDTYGFNIEVEVSSIKDLDALGVNIFPNPVVDNFNVEIPNSLTGSQLVLRNVQGQIVFSKMLTQEMNTFNASSIPAGVYVMQLKGKDWSVSQKWIKLNK